MIFPSNSSFISPITFLFFLQARVCLFQNLKSTSLYKIFCNIFLNIICFYMDNEAVCIHITYIFTIFWFYIIIPKLQFYLDLTLVNLNKQAYSLILESFLFLFIINFMWKILFYDNLFLILNTFFSFLLFQVYYLYVFLTYYTAFPKIALFISLKKSFSNCFLLFVQY